MSLTPAEHSELLAVALREAIRNGQVYPADTIQTQATNAVWRGGIETAAVYVADVLESDDPSFDRVRFLAITRGDVEP